MNARGVGAVACTIVFVAAIACALVWHRGQVHSLTERVRAEEQRAVQVETDRALAEAAMRNKELETRAAIAELENQVEQDRLKDMARAAAERARTADDRLQLATADLRRRAAAAAAAARPGSFAAEAAAAASALGECSSRYRALGAVADGLSVQVTGLQRYVGIVLGVCFPSPHQSEPQPSAPADAAAIGG